MLTNSIEYKDLVNRISSFLSIDSSKIYSVSNPLRNKKIKNVYMVTIKNSRGIMLKDTNDGLIRL